MDNNGGGNGESVDDQGTGWFQVKKKHRSSSKFSLQSWVGGLSRRSASNPLRSRPSRSDNSVNASHDNKRLDQQPKGREDCVVRSQTSVVTTSVSVSNENDRNVQCVNNSVANKLVENPKSTPLTLVGASSGGVKFCEKVSQTDKSDVGQNVRVDFENSGAVGIKFGAIGDDNLIGFRGDECGPNCAFSYKNSQDTNSANSTVSDQLCQLSTKTESKEEVSLENAEVSIPSESPDDRGSDFLICEATQIEPVKQGDEKSLMANSPSGVEAGIAMEVQDLMVSSDLGEREISEVSKSNVDVIEINQESVLAGSDSKIFEKQPVETLVVGDTASSTQNMNPLGESDTVESKERFRQRLWCFLFENLNRSVDELYLLCELECDLEQMKEAILVLEEAASDFKDLTSRVEEFESMKKSSPQFSNGTPINLKSDHRRPHALSWEVRRMTTSAHKAEILSSSLEAFKKIQQERASLRQVNDARVFLNLESDSLINQSSTVSDGLRSEKDLVGESRLEPQSAELASSGNLNSLPNGHVLPQVSTSSVTQLKLPPRDSSGAGKSKRELPGPEAEKLLLKKVKMVVAEGVSEKNSQSVDHSKRQIPVSSTEQPREKEKRSSDSWKSMDAWKEKRNWRAILSSPFRVSSRVSHSPSMSRKSAERARMLHDKLMSPEKKKKTAVDLKKEAEEKHARATRIRSELENERSQKLQKTSEKLNRVSEWQADRSMKLRQGMYARQQRSESRHEAFLAQVVKRAGDESSKVNEVRFITSLNEENKKLILRQKLHDSEMRRAEKLLVMKSKQKEDVAREEAVLERRKLIEAEKLQRLAETQRRKEEAQIRREEERKASSAAREARALEQLRRKEERAKAQQEEAELLAQKLAEKLSESEQRRKFYLEQIRERASMDFRDQSSPLLRRLVNKENQGRSTPTNTTSDDNNNQANGSSGSGGSTLMTSNSALQQHSMKRRIKRIRQRLMALKYEFPEPQVGAENATLGYRTAMGTARMRIGRWLQELQRLRQARNEGAASIGLITAEMIKYLEGKEPELLASRQAGLIDFIASALPASHTSKPEACQVTIHLLKLLKVVLSISANRSYFIAQNMLPPIIPMLSVSLENYIKIAASLNLPGNTNLPSNKTSADNFESITEVLDGFLWTVTTIIGHINSEEQQILMRDGLIELMTAYQVIHRLRDLFALYDRPQVEGSPFPSSILLSIYLLVVLTSRPESNCSIDWESLHTKTSKENGCTIENFGDLGPSLSSLSGIKIINLEDVPEDTPLDSDKVDRINSEFSAASKEVCGEDSVKSLSPPKVERNFVDVGIEQMNVDQPVGFLLSAISETGLVSLLSVLTAVLLQANNRLSSDQGSYVLPSNFEEVATGVLKVLNNLALLDLKLLQTMLSRLDLKVEFFHLLSFLLSHCNSKWKTANDQVGMLLLESLSLLGHFALFHPGNQAVLRWGKTPTILHKICDLPFVFFSDPELMPSLASALVAACYGCEQNKGVVQQEISTDMLLSLLRSCRNLPTECGGGDNPLNAELKKAQADLPSKLSRHSSRNPRVGSGKNGSRNGKVRNQREFKPTTKGSEEMGVKQCSETTPSLSMMLHCRLSLGFIDKAEHFFSCGVGEVVV